MLENAATIDILEKTQDLFLTNLKARLKEFGWKIPRLAKATGISASGLYGIAGGANFPGPDNLDRIAKALGWPVWRLFSASDEKSEIPPTPEQALAVLEEAIKKPSLALVRPPVVRVAALLDRLHDAELDHAADLINGIIEDREAAGADSPVEPS